MNNLTMRGNALSIQSVLQGGKYVINRVLGQGGFGITYLAYNTFFDECVAIKEFFMKGVTERDVSTCGISVSNDDNALQFEEQKEKFKKEAKRLRKLNNDHIVKVYDLFEENGTAYYVMNYIEGESLAERLKKTGKPLSEDEVSKLLPQLLDALSEVHQYGIWHLDIKPGNIMVDKQGKAYLIDFGASKQIRAGGHFTTSTALCYTPGYAPTEQIGQMYDRFGPWTDIYALGATVYCLLTNKMPPMTMDIEEDGESAFEFPANVSDKIRRMVMWMMQPWRKKRPQSVEEIERRLAEPVTVDEGDCDVEDEENERTILSERVSGHTDVLPTSPEEKTILLGDGYDASLPTLSPVIMNLINNMVSVEGGTFTMGATPEQGKSGFMKGPYSDEKPTHQVTLSSFSIGRYEVTQEEWETVMGSNPSENKGATLPVENVSWDDCQEFISKLNAMTRRNFRLPTEAEWEFAARGGVMSRGYKFAGGDDLEIVAWCFNNSAGETHEVGMKLPNELGLYDMSGNVREWCQDWKAKYSPSAQTNPIELSSGGERVCRGGDATDFPRNCRVAYRAGMPANVKSSNIGLRLVEQNPNY